MEPRSGGWPRVLIVEDESDFASLLTRMTLAMWPAARVRVSGDGIEAGAAALAHRPDIVITDVRLPGRSGYDLCRWLRHQPALAAAKVLVVSAFPSERARHEAFLAGADEFLAKPFPSSAFRRCFLNLAQVP